MSNFSTMVEAGGAPLAAGAVLLHTVPRSAADVDAEEAVWRQYNSCVDFSFQESRGNARKLKRLNAIFERAADRRSGGIREDKILRILPSGTATKYGIDPSAVRRRLQLRREWQEESKRTSATAKADGGKPNRRRRKKSSRNHNQQQRDGSGDGIGETSTAAAEQNDSVEALANLGPCPELRVLSRGTFLAMFANETTAFVNTMAQNDRADRERRSARRNNVNSAGRDPGGHANVGFPSEQHTPPPDTGVGVLLVDNGATSATCSYSTANGVLGEMTNHEMTNHHASNNLSSPSSSAAGQQYQLLPEITSNPSPSTDVSSSIDNVNGYPIRSDTGREDKTMRRVSRSRSGRRSGGRSDKNRRRAVSGNDSRDVNGHNHDATYMYEDDASISSLSTMGNTGRRTDGSMDRHRFGHHRTDSTSTLSSVGGDSYRSLNRSLSHDQEYFTNVFATGNDDCNVLSPESCNSSLAGNYGFSHKSAFPFPGTSEECRRQPQLQLHLSQITEQQPSPYQAHHSADVAAGGLPTPPRTEIPPPPVDMKMGELQKPKLIERSKSDSSNHSSSRRKKKRTGNSGRTRSRRSLDDSSSLGSGSYQSGGKLIGQSPSKEERNAMRRERRRRKEEKRKADLQLERHRRELDTVSNVGTANSAAQYGHVLAYSDSQQFHQQQFLPPALPVASPPEQLFNTVPQGVYNCEQNTGILSENEQDCVFFSSICSLLQRLVPGLADNKKVLVSAAPPQQPGAPLPTQVPNVPGVVLPSSTSQQPMIGLGHLGHPLVGGHHRRAASLTNPASISPAHKFYVRHQRTNSIDGRLPPGFHQHHPPQQQLVGIVPLGVAASPSTPDLAGLAFLATPHKPMVAPPVLSSVGSRSESPLDLRASLPSSLQALAQNDPGLHQQLHVSSAISFSSVSSHSTNGSGTLAGEFVVIA